MDTYQYNGFNQLTGMTGSDGSATSFGYDGNGNQVRKTETPSGGAAQVTQYVYDEDNRLTGIALPSGASNAFEYDANGLRTRKTDSSGTSSFLLDGLSVVARYAPDSTRQAWYTQSLARIDEVLSVVNGSGKFWYQADALGSTYTLTTSTGAVQARGGYDVFGAPVAVSGASVGQPFGFTGREHEGDSGLVYARARYLQPGAGRWDRPDPAGMIDGPELYAYVSGSPVSLRDPHGLFVTALHVRMTERALDGAATPEDIALLLRAQTFADSATYQAEAYSNWHAMRSPGQTQSQAHDQWWNYLIYQLHSAADYENRPCAPPPGPHVRAMASLGLGMHAVQDFFSPSHYGFQTWHDMSQDLGPLPGVVSHVAREAFMNLRSPQVVEAMSYTVRYFQAFKALSRMPVISPEMALAVFGNDLWYEALWSYTGESGW